MTAPTAKPLRVLLIEDRDEDVILTQRALRRAGYAAEVLHVQSEADFLSALQSQPDVILSDCNLPSFGARHALQLVKQRGDSVPFIILSGTIMDSEAEELLAEGAHAFVLKDDIARLAPAIEAALRGGDAAPPV